MKILTLRFSNLNSLRGEWTIDFSRSPLSEAGLFAIVGPTGAGKTTILDAITLALYGRAARYGMEPNPGEIMSRHSGACSAEVEFSCSSGQAFRSVWQLHRARNKPDGKLQNPVRKVIALPQEEVLTQKLEESNRQVEELIGLSYERFLRSVMLAQGDFAAFLRAKPNERTELLEQITGTQIYSQISTAAYEQASLAREGYETLLRTSEAVQLLSGQDREARQEELLISRQRTDSLAAEFRTLQARLQEAGAYLTWQEEQQQIATEEQAIAREQEEGAAKVRVLEMHERATPFVARLTKLDLLSASREKSEQQLAALKQDLPRHVAACETAAVALTKSRADLTQLEEEHERLKPLWAAVVELDSQITQSRKTLDERGRAWKTTADSHEKISADLAKSKQQHEENQQALGRVEDWMAKHARDHEIEPVLSDLRVCLSQWRGADAQSAAMRLELESLTSTVKRHRQSATEAGKTAQDLEARAKTQSDALTTLRAEITSLTDGRALAVWEEQRDAEQTRLAALEKLAGIGTQYAELLQRQQALEKEHATLAQQTAQHAETLPMYERQVEVLADLVVARQKRIEDLTLIQNLEQHRHTLVNGSPCPLCGALEHPYAAPDALPSAELTVARADLKEAQSQLQLARKRHTELQAEGTAHKVAMQRVSAELAEKQRDAAGALKSWKSLAGPLGLQDANGQLENVEPLRQTAAANLNALKLRIEKLRALLTKEAQGDAAAVQTAAAVKARWAEKDKFESLCAQAEQAHKAAQAKLAQSEESRVACASRFATAVLPFGETVEALAAADAVLQRLQKRAELHVRAREKKALCLTTKQSLEAAQAELQKRADDARQQVGTAQAAQQAEQSRLNQLTATRAERFGTKQVADEQRRFDESLKARQQGRQAATEAESRTRQAREICEKQMAELSAGLQSTAGEIATLQAALAAEILPVGFADVVALRAAALPEQTVAELTTWRRQLHDRSQALLGRKSAHAERRGKLTETAVADAADLQPLRERLAVLEGERSSAQQRIGALELELKQDDQRRTEQAALSRQIDAAQLELSRWERLSKLIGSASGVVFARFAQELTLERLVHLANRHLRLLNPRYSLRRDVSGAEPLEVQIIDHYQADVSRSMRSLSGGESFLASLALALGMSDLASGRAAIESLFIDEGFGTLDAETLETAMAALENLQAGGKTIGVISHVESMKERIRTQVRVSRRQGGCSAVEVVA